ncbi:Conserved hypothetical protein [Yarrowia lipolytica]|nr:Conserved hypothetical protein [Yarrowia lipolytica]
MSSIESLPTDQREKVESFVSITDWKGDPALAVVLLQSSQWNLELALSRHFDGATGDLNTETSTQTQESSRQGFSPGDFVADDDDIPGIPHSANTNSDNHEVVDTNHPPSGPSYFQTRLKSLLLLPFTAAYKAVSSIFYVLSTVLPFLPRITGIYPSNRGAAHSERKSINPRDTAARFIRHFEDTYGNEHGLEMFEGGYSQALDTAKRGLRFLVVLLMSPAHDDTPAFYRDILCSAQVVVFLKENHVIVWGGDVRESEAFQVASQLKCTSFPFSALVAPSPRSGSNIREMIVLHKIQHLVTAPRWIHALEQGINGHRGKLASLAMDQQERDLTRRLRQEQEEAYERSLAQDRARDQQRAREREAVAEAERAAAEAERHKELQAQKRQQWIKWRAGKIKEKKEDDASTPTARVGIRVPSGTRLNCKFPAYSTLEDLYAYVECHELLNGDDDFSDVEKPEDYDHEYSFELVSPMPRKVIKPVTDVTVQEEPAIWPNGALNVEVVDEEED